MTYKYSLFENSFCWFVLFVFLTYWVWLFKCFSFFLKVSCSFPKGFWFGFHWFVLLFLLVFHGFEVLSMGEQLVGFS